MKNLILLFTACFLCCYTGYSQNEDLSNGLVFEGEPYMVIDPANASHIVVAWMGSVALQHVAIKVKASFDGGQTWSAGTYLAHESSTYTSADVSMAFDHSGNLFITYIDSRQSPDSGGVFIRKSTDGGLTFGGSSQVISGFADGTKYPLDRPWLTITSGGGASPDTLYVTTKPAPWVAPPNRPYFTKSYDNGVTWSAWRNIDTVNYLVGSLIQAPMAAPAVDSAGQFHCIYPTYVAAVSLYPRYILASLQRGANNFTRSVACTVTGAGTVDTLAKAGYRLICDPTNNGHYALFSIANLTGDLDVYFIETRNAGATWTTPVRVNDDPSGNGKMQDLVWSNFDEFGNIITAWRDRRNAPGTGYQQPSEIWGAVKWGDSTAFSANFRISDTIVAYDSLYLSGNGNDFLNVAMAQDTLSAVWGDVRTGVLNIWFDRCAMSSGSHVGIQNIVSEKVPQVSIFPDPADNYNCLSASVELNLRYARKLSERFPGVSCTVQN